MRGPATTRKKLEIRLKLLKNAQKELNLHDFHLKTLVFGHNLVKNANISQKSVILSQLFQKSVILSGVKIKKRDLTLCNFNDRIIINSRISVNNTKPSVIISDTIVNTGIISNINVVITDITTNTNTEISVITSVDTSATSAKH